MMDRTSKISRLKSLKKLIDKQELILKAAQEDLEGLKEEYKRESISELPILLFEVDTTINMPEPEDYEFTMVYYYPDLDKVSIFSRKYGTERPSNTLDLRDKFDKLGMPTHKYVGNPDSDIVDEAVTYLKEQIEEIFKNEEINSWAELGKHLENMKVAKKILK